MDPQLSFFLVSIALLCLPGWAILSLLHIGQDWRTLQRWILAVGLSIAFYPVLFYASRFLLPDLRWGINKIWILLGLFLLITVYSLWKEKYKPFDFEATEWLAIAIFAATIVTRFWIIQNEPFPAWSDALHHTLLTQMAAEKGQLPFTLEPYEPTRLDMYHLGLYSITSLEQNLAGIPAHSALLYTAQLLNGLCGIGVYLLLDKKVSRIAAIAGAVFIGFYSFQPAWYVNWSRDTSLAANTIILIAWLVAWEAIRQGRTSPAVSKTKLAGWILLAAILNAGVFMLHFRVAGYYIPLLFITVLWEGFFYIRARLKVRFSAIVVSIAAVSILLILPVLIPAFSNYVTMASTSQPITSESLTYFETPIDAIFLLGIQPWLFFVTCAVTVIALIRLNPIAWLTLIWIGFLYLEGMLYLTGTRLLMFTSLSGLMVVFYLPASLLFGVGLSSLVEWVGRIHNWRPRLEKLALVILCFTAFLSSFYRATGIQPYRYFISQGELESMEWIKNNTAPEDTFAINTYFWMPKSFHGTDAGFWIPYLAGRKTNTATMLASLNGSAFYQETLSKSIAVQDAINDPSRIKDLCDYGLDYIYIGDNKTAIWKDFNPSDILRLEQADLVFSQPNAQIFKIRCP